MYIYCSRCQFRVPDERHICHICGNALVRRMGAKAAPSAMPPPILDTINVIGQYGEKELIATAKALRSAAARGLANGLKRCEALLSAANLLAARSAATRLSTTRKARSAKRDIAGQERDSQGQDSFDFLATYRSSYKVRAKVKELPHAEPKASDKPDTAKTKMQIDELIGWFQEYGREGLLIAKPLAADQRQEERQQLCDAA